MITASAGFVSAVQQDARHFYAQIIHDNSVVDCEVMNFTLKKGAFDNSDFLVGAVYSSSAEIHVTGLTDALENEDVSLQVGLEVSGAVEYITVGTFTVTKAQSTAYETILTCGGFISTKLNATLPTVATQTLANIAAAITSTTGVSITFSGFASTDITVTKSLLNVTCRGALELIAFLLGGYATEQADGSVVVQKFTTTGASLAVDGDVMQSAPVTAGDVFTMTGVKVIQSPAYESEDASGQPTVVPEVSWTSGSPLRQTYNSEYMTASAFTIFAADIVGYSFTPAVVSVALGDPRLEACDVLTVTDLDESVYTVPCHMIDATYDGGYMMTVTAFGESESESVPEGTVVKELNALATKLDSAEAATAIAKQAAAQAQSSADDAATAAANAQTSADDAASAAATANTNASAAVQAANTANANASAAQASATSARASANTALYNLSTVEQVVDTLTWIAQHGVYTKTTDVTLDPSKVYYTVTASAVATPSDDYIATYYELVSGAYVKTTDTTVVTGKTYYTVDGAVVIAPDVADIGTYYELSVSDAVSDYINTHLALTDDGLFVTKDGSSWRVKVDNDSVDIIDENGDIVASYSSEIVIGIDTASNVLLDANGLNIRNASNVLARFGSTSQIGQDGTYRLELDDKRLSLVNSVDAVVFEAKASGATQTRRVTKSYFIGSASASATVSFPVSAGQTLVAGSPVVLNGEVSNFLLDELTFSAGTSATKNATHNGSTLGSVVYDGTHTFTLSTAGGGGRWQRLRVQFDILANYDMGSVTVSGVLYDNNLAGAVQMYAGQITQSVSGGVVSTTAPTGWLLCDGSAVSRTTYDRLFAVIGTTYGTGDGSTTFNLPDLRGKFPLGVSSSHALASTGGSENAIVPYHRHALGELTTGNASQGHTHGVGNTDSTHFLSRNNNSGSQTRSAVGTSGSAYTWRGTTAGGFNSFANTGGQSQSHTHSLTSGQYTNYTPSGGSGNTTGANMPPFISMNFIIATGQTS